MCPNFGFNNRTQNCVISSLCNKSKKDKCLTQTESVAHVFILGFSWFFCSGNSHSDVMKINVLLSSDMDCKCIFALNLEPHFNDNRPLISLEVNGFVTLLFGLFSHSWFFFPRECGSSKFQWRNPQVSVTKRASFATQGRPIFVVHYLTWIGQFCKKIQNFIQKTWVKSEMV